MLYLHDLYLIISNYEGRSINKLQNGAIPLILKIGNVTVTSS